MIAEIQFWDKLTALCHMGEHLGMYRQIHKHRRWADELARITDAEHAREALESSMSEGLSLAEPQLGPVRYLEIVEKEVMHG